MICEKSLPSQAGMNDGDFMITYRNLEEHEITLPLFDAFQRRQIVTKCWRREAGRWVIREIGRAHV